VCHKARFAALHVKFVFMQTGCIHCGQQHLLQDDVVAKHTKVQFRCTRCSQTTIVELQRKPDETVVISPMPSFARADASTVSLVLPPAGEGLQLPADADVVLHVTSGPDKGTVFTLKKARTVIGRKGADFALGDPEISRHHCLLEVRERSINLKDLGSTNGTFFAEERVRAALLQDGAEFRVGSSVIRVKFKPKETSVTQTSP
jgi:Inner membrane component of T3SS, cytoplasmic domain